MFFKKEHKDMILNGTKTATRRVWKRPMVKVGGIYKAKLKMLSKDYFAKIQITKLYKQKLVKMTIIDAINEGYQTLDSFWEIWEKINKIKFNPNTEVDVIEFKVVEVKE